MTNVCPGLIIVSAGRGKESIAAMGEVPRAIND